MNAGGFASRADVLVFLHADTRLPIGWDEAVRRAVARGCVGGAFDFAFAGHPLGRGLRRQTLRLVQVLNRARFRAAGGFFGDQVIFCTAAAFHTIGGYPKVGLLEDVRFAHALRRLGRTATLQPPVRTSPRRFLERGVLRQLTHDFVLLGRDACGLPCRSRHYNALNRTGHRTQAFGPDRPRR